MAKKVPGEFHAYIAVWVQESSGGSCSGVYKRKMDAEWDKRNKVCVEDDVVFAGVLDIGPLLPAKAATKLKKLWATEATYAQEA